MESQRSELTPEERHRARLETLRRTLESEEALSGRVSFVRLISFLVALIVLISAASDLDPAKLAIGGGSLALFFALIFYHSKVALRVADLEALIGVHERHLMRIDGSYLARLPPGPPAPRGHAYASDVDLFGPQSLAHRIDTTQSVMGEEALLRLLGEPAPRDEIPARQEAIEELARDLDFRERFEASVSGRTMKSQAKSSILIKERLDPRDFLTFLKEGTRGLPPLLSAYAWISPPITVGLLVAASVGLMSYAPFAASVMAQLLVSMTQAARFRPLFDLVSSKKGNLDAYFAMWKVVEEKEFEAPVLRALRERTFPAGEKPSATLAELETKISLSELRYQFPIHFLLDTLLLWDLHVARSLIAYREKHRDGFEEAFTALGELEALVALATFRAIEPESVYPEIAPPGEAFEARDLTHPLIKRTERVANDLVLSGPSSLLIVTGSNMAGKSTLLRSVGLAISVGLAGGPVLAARLRMPELRLRTSMRIDDDLQAGASYYYAELQRIRGVIDGAEAEPPIFFLLDELLRGTNAEARLAGSRAILEHLLDRGAMGLVATHDFELTKLENEREGVENQHFTDVIRDDEMVFDYSLREGVVKQSNALRLLAGIGIEIPVKASAAPSDET